MIVVEPKSLQICNISFPVSTTVSKSLLFNTSLQARIAQNANGNASDDEAEVKHKFMFQIVITKIPPFF